MENPQSVLKSKIYRVKDYHEGKTFSKIYKYRTTQCCVLLELSLIILLYMLCSIFKAVHLFSNATDSLCLQNHRHHVQITLIAATYCPNRPLVLHHAQIQHLYNWRAGPIAIFPKFSVLVLLTCLLLPPVLFRKSAAFQEMKTSNFILISLNLL